jgi:hypothetical protein
MKMITFLSDFGYKDSYVAQMKAVASCITDAHLVDISHDVTPHHIREGAFLLRSVVPYFPAGTVHVAVVDPGVGTERKGLVITTNNSIFVGPDNGLLLPAAHYCNHFFVYEISNERYMRSSVSHTFHGRDIFSPIAAHITSGVPFGEIGPRVSDFIDLEFGEGVLKNNMFLGKVIHTDRFGNIITNISGKMFCQHVDYNSKLSVIIKEKNYQVPFVKSYGFVNQKKFLITMGSSGFIEIGANQGHAATELGVSRDDEIRIEFS